MHFEKHKMKNVFNLAAVVLLTAVANSVHAETSCSFQQEDSLCNIQVNCTGAADPNLMEALKHGLEDQNSCVRKTRKNYRYEYPYSSSFHIFLDINFNLDAVWNTDVLDSHISTIRLNNIETVPQKIKSFRNLKEIAFVNSTVDFFDLNRFLGLASLSRINASSNSIKYVQSNISSDTGYAQIIDLSNNRIETLPNQCFSRFVELKCLNLSHNSIKNIEILTFEGVHKLKVLDLSHNVLTQVDQSLARFESLKELYINNNNLCSITGTNFKILTKLEKLDLKNNQLKSVGDDAFKTLTELKELNLSNNDLENISFDTSAMKNLVHFNAERNNINAIPKFMLKNFVSLVEFDISKNQITRLEPQMFIQANKLRKIDLSNNMIGNAITAKFFQGLSEVVEIQLGQNIFTSIENEAFNGLHKLQTVNFSHCNIESVGYNAFNNTGSIHVLVLSYNSIHNFSLLPASVTEVKEFYINNNKIQHFSGETFATLPRLIKFTIANNNFLNETVLLTASKRLSYVDMSNTRTDFRTVLNNVDTLSELSIANVRNHLSFEYIINKTVYYLDLSFNEIENINNVFVFNIQNLTCLNLRSNKLSFIDKFSFQNMPDLRRLDLSNNCISQIQPGSFIHTNNIVDLSLHGNSLETLKFGMFEGLQHLLTLNLSDNMIHEFSINILYSTPILSKIILDNNQIKDIRLNSFIKSNVTVISIGGNPMSCHILANFKQYISSYQREISKGNVKNISITGETLDYHNDNFHGVRCVSDVNPINDITWPEVSNDINSSTTLLRISKELKNFRIAIETALNRSDDKNVIENSNITNLLKSIDIDVNNNTKSTATSIENMAKNIVIMNKNTGQLLESLNGFIKILNATRNIDTKLKYVNVSETSVLDQHLNEKLEIMNDEKERLVKELKTIFKDLKISPKVRTEAQIYENVSFSDIKGVLYFVAICLTIIIIIFFCVITFMIFKNKKVLQRNDICNSSSQPIANAMELS